MIKMDAYNIDRFGYTNFLGYSGVILDRHIIMNGQILEGVMSASNQGLKGERWVAALDLGFAKIDWIRSEHQDLYSL